MSRRPEFSADLAASKAWGELAKVFTAARLDTPVIDARLLVCHALGLDRMGLIKDPSRLLGERAAVLTEVARRRLTREPVSRIVGERSFHGRQFKVTAATLDPRPDSETLVDAALNLHRLQGNRPDVRILDLGTGTGCLLLTLLAELPQARGVGIDISLEALETAQLNAGELGLAARADFHRCDWISTLAGAFDLVVSNPPYIPSGDIDGLQPEVAKFDPRLALDGGQDGLAAFRAILAAPPTINPGGSFLFEVGAGQAAEVEALLDVQFSLAGTKISRFRDLSGVERVVAATFPRL